LQFAFIPPRCRKIAITILGGENVIAQLSVLPSLDSPSPPEI
jgi:hypothetical protein